MRRRNRLANWLEGTRNHITSIVLLFRSIFSNNSFKSLVDAEKLNSEEERKQFAQAVAKLFNYDDTDRLDASESAEDIDIYSFVSPI